MAVRKRSGTRRKVVRGFAKNAAIVSRRLKIPVKRARAILAVGARRASPAAKRANPRLRRVKMAKRKRR
jgi:hypothetical protein